MSRVLCLKNERIQDSISLELQNRQRVVAIIMVNRFKMRPVRLKTDKVVKKQLSYVVKILT